MKVLQIFTVVSMIVFHSTSYGKTDPVVQKMMDAMKEKGIVPKKKKALAPQCANFSGNWKGTCVYKHGPVEQEMSILQEACDSVTIDGLYLNISGSASYSSWPNQDFASPYGVVIALEWNDSQTKLKSLLSLIVDNGSTVVSVASSQWLSGNQLRTKTEYATPIMTVDGPTDVYGYTSDCTYDRVTGSH